MRRGTLVLFIALLGALTSAFAHEARAQRTDIHGLYVLDPQAGDDVGKVIEGVVADMNFIKKPLARKRLTSTNQPPQRIEISATASEVSVTTDGQDVIRTPGDGRAVEWTRKDGETFTISTVRDARVITRTFRADDGQRVNTYTFSPDGATLTMIVVVTSPQLPDPLAYKLVYRRSGSSTR
jgi:hypothetical protein